MQIPSLLKNKYAIATMAFVVWVTFFDRNDLFTQYHLRSDLKDLQQKKEYYIQQIAQTENDRQELISSQQKLERFAREKYMMKKDNEDLFIVRYSGDNGDK
jgi:cell division protein FtsB